MNEEQRKQRDARVAELAEETVESSEVGGNLTRSEIEDLEAQARMRINLALDEQAKEIAAILRDEQRILESLPSGRGVSEQAQARIATEAAAYRTAAEIAAGFGDDR